VENKKALRAKMHRGRIIAVPPQFIRAFRPFHTNLKSYNVATVPEGQLRGVSSH